MDIRYFSRIVGEEDFICSFDGGCFLHTKNKNAKESVCLKDLWLHNDSPVESCKDRHLERRKGDYVQEVVDCGEDDGLILLDQGRKYRDFFYDYCEKYPTTGYAFSRTNAGDDMFRKMGLLKYALQLVISFFGMVMEIKDFVCVLMYV